MDFRDISAEIGVKDVEMLDPAHQSAIETPSDSTKLFVVTRLFAAAAGR